MRDVLRARVRPAVERFVDDLAALFEARFARDIELFGETLHSALSMVACEFAHSSTSTSSAVEDSPRPTPQAQQEGAATPGQRASAAVGNVAEPHRVTKEHRDTDAVDVDTSRTTPKRIRDYKPENYPPSRRAREDRTALQANGKQPPKCKLCGYIGGNSRGCGRSHPTQASGREGSSHGAAGSVKSAATSDDESEGEPRARRRSSRAVDPAPELPVIPHAALVRMLATDRENNQVVDVGGLPLRRGEPSLIGHADTKREHCDVHGWVGRVAFERDRHDNCQLDGELCQRCDGARIGLQGRWCDRCDGTGVEPTRGPKPAAEPLTRLVAAPGVALDSRDRNRRRIASRAVTLSPKRITRAALRAGEQEVELAGPPVNEQRPKTRGECAGGQRPCPWISCKHHLYIDVDPDTGSIKFNFPDVEPDQLIESCSLDIADRGGIVLEDIANMLNLTRERVRMIELEGCAAARSLAIEQGINPEDAQFPRPGDSAARRTGGES